MSTLRSIGLLSRVAKGALPVLASVVVLSCGGDDGGDGTPAASPCQRLEDMLCDRTADCAVEAGQAAAADRAQFHTRCLASLARDLTCHEPADGDFDLCSEGVQQIPCAVVVTYLEQDMVVAPANSCADYFF